jgi:hypothetical protein
MKSRSTDFLFIGSAFCAASVVATGTLAVFGVDERGISIALQVTGRLQFLLFWVAYAGRPTAYLFGPRFRPVAQQAREFGLAFAAALFVHLTLVSLLCFIGKAPATGVFVFFGVAAIFAYLLVLFSIPRLHGALGGVVWWVLTNVGMNYIAYAFFADFFHEPVSGGVKHVVEYLPFAVLAGGALALRLLAYGKSAHGWLRQLVFEQQSAPSRQ